MKQIIESLIRTAVPFIVGFLVSFLASQGITLPPETLANLTSFITLGVGVLYYLVVRLVETKLPQAGWLLGIAKQPVYASDKTAYVVPVHTAVAVDNKVKETK